MSCLALTEENDKGTFELQSGDEVAISLRENPTTGYRWQLQAEGPIEIVSDEFERPPDAGIGGGGVRRVRARVTAAGDAKITGQLRRAWEPPESAQQSVEFSFHVH